MRTVSKPCFFGGDEIEFLAERGHKLRAHLFPDADGAVPLHVAVAAHRTEARAAATDLAPQQGEVHDRLHVADAVFVLRDAHRPGADHPLGLDGDLRRLVNDVAREAAVLQDAFPALVAEVVGKRLKALGVLLDEVVGQHFPAGAVVLGEHFLHHALQERDVAVDTDRHEQTGQLRAGSQHVQRLLRILKTHQTRLEQRVNADDLAAVAGRLLQFGQHPRMIGAGILADDEDRVGMLKIRDPHGRFADADRFVQTRAARFVAHVRAVGQVVGAELAGEQSPQEGRFVAGTARRVEGRLVGRIERTQLAADQVERVVPRNRLVEIGAFAAEHRMRDAAQLVKRNVALLEQLGDRMAGKDLGGQPRGRRFERDGLGAVLAELGRLAFAVGVGPRAARTVKTILLIDLEQRLQAADDAHMLETQARRLVDGVQPSGRFVSMALVCTGRFQWRLRPLDQVRSGWHWRLVRQWKRLQPRIGSITFAVRLVRRAV